MVEDIFIAGTGQYAKAEEVCKNHKMRLLTIEDQEEMGFIVDILPKKHTGRLFEIFILRSSFEIEERLI